MADFYLLSPLSNVEILGQNKSYLNMFRSGVFAADLSLWLRYTFLFTRRPYLDLCNLSTGHRISWRTPQYPLHQYPLPQNSPALEQPQKEEISKGGRSVIT